MRVYIIIFVYLVSGVVYGFSAKSYDKDNDLVINESEFTKWIRDKKSKSLNTYDQNGDSALTEQEIQAAIDDFKSLTKKVEKDIVEFNEDYPGGIKIKEFAVRYGAEDKKNFIEKKSPIYIRANYEDIPFSAKLEPETKVKPAQISFEKDVNSDGEVLRVKGVIMYPIKKKDDAPLWVPSLEFNQVRNNGDDSKEVDSLLFRFNGNFELDNILTDTSYLRAGLHYATDTSFKQDVYGLDLSYEPILLGKGERGLIDFFNLRYKWTGFLVGEFGQINDPGENVSLAVDDKYSRAGAKIKLSLMPEDFKRFNANFEYTYLDTISGKLRDRKYFSGSVSYDLTDEGNYSLLGSYINGDKSISLEDEETWSIGLGVKF